MKTKSDVHSFVYDVLYNFITCNAETIGLWPTIKVFRKNNHIAIGMAWSVDSKVYDENINLSSYIIKKSIPFDIVLNVFQDVNSPDIKTLPLDDRSCCVVYYLDNIIHASIRKTSNGNTDLA